MEQLDEFFADQILQTAHRRESVSVGSLDEKGTTSTLALVSIYHPMLSVELSDEQWGQLKKLKDEMIRVGWPGN